MKLMMHQRQVNLFNVWFASMHQNIVQHRIKLGMVSLCIERLEKISTTIKRDREFAHAFEPTTENYVDTK
jgi:hypothetical protein